MNIPGVPETIERQTVMDFITSLGLSLDHLIRLSVNYNSIEAEVYAVDENGKNYIASYMDGGGEIVGSEIAKHKVTIPFADVARGEAS